jgi:hypothetical protein
VNIDYAICRAIDFFAGTPQFLVVYDVCCQWSIHFLERARQGPYLGVREGLDIIPAVGQWHLSAHRRDCFFQYSLNFIQGSARQSGEMMETLWAVLDNVSGITRAMSYAHRQEVLDDYMYDSNWKKLCGIRKCASLPWN